MRSVILSAASRLLFALLFMFSIFLTLRGHHLPGGGFIGGLVASSAFILLATSFPVSEAKEILRVEPYYLVGTGLLLSASSGLPALFTGGNFLQGKWGELDLFGTHVHLGTPLLFDLGVYLVVIGFTLVIIFSFQENQDE